MRRLIIAACAVLPALLESGCATGYGYGGGIYAGGPYAYDGFYDNFYGPIYDGYWGNDGFFYFRGSVGDRRFRRGDAAHFSRGSARAGNFHSMQGSMTPSRGMQMPHFPGHARRGRSGHR